MQQHRKRSAAARGLVLLALSLGFSTAAWAQQSTFVCSGARASASEGRVPAVIHYDFGLQSNNYINTVTKSFDVSNPSASCAEISL